MLPCAKAQWLCANIFSWSIREHLWGGKPLHKTLQCLRLFSHFFVCLFWFLLLLFCWVGDGRVLTVKCNLTCVSDRLSCLASSVRSRPTTYWHRWNSSSSRYSCSAVNEVRVRLGRSRSRPFGSTISRMVPFASIWKNTTTKHKDEHFQNVDTINQTPPCATSDNIKVTD